MASLPPSETTLKRTLPLWIKKSPLVESPWEKMVFFFVRETISRPLPIVERNERGLKLRLATTCSAFGKVPLTYRWRHGSYAGVH